MTFKIGQTVQRREGNRNTAPMELRGKHDVEYLAMMQARGYEYAVVKDVDDLDFDLPEVVGTKATALRVHPGGNTCVSCEG